METMAGYLNGLFDDSADPFMGIEECFQPLTYLEESAENGVIFTVDEVNEQFNNAQEDLSIENFDCALLTCPATDNVEKPRVPTENPQEPFPHQSIKINTLYEQPVSTVATKKSKLAAKKLSGGGERKLHLYQKDPALESDKKERKKIERAIRMKEFHEKRKRMSKIDVPRLLATKDVLTTILNGLRSGNSDDMPNVQNAIWMFHTLNMDA